ncbi:hypothetical protein QVD17_39376 [Tagetes erecta]|uniref:BED-type domain-containing protein n=1 Tax=Tagetes erecta TaxID=13708 RepID=A0AAD8JNE8_TARER|nr:hypothetical protein QVD17_39376 [Tagetes erecta]
MSKDHAESSSQSKKDPGWKYNYLKDDKDKNSVTCIFCMKVTTGGIFRAKLHQVGGNRNARACPKCPNDVKEELKAYIESQKSKKNFDGFNDLDFEQGGFGDDEHDEDEVMERPNLQKKRTGINIGGIDKKMKSNVKGPLDLYMKKGKGKAVQTSIHDACDKELRARTIQKIAAFFYQSGIAFNVAKMDTFKEMIAAIGNYGPNLKPPSYHELRVPLLRNEVENVEKWIDGQKLEWAKIGCSIMSDGWTDRRQRTLINFLVNSSKGTVFMESVDASSYAKTGEKVFELLDNFVELIGEKNVVQVITDNGSNFKKAGEFLMEKRKHLFWTPCAAHCLDLMLEDIGKLPKIKKTLEKGIFLVGYIYNHCGVLNLMREFTKNELTRSGITRFATTYLTLRSLRNEKSGLRSMFVSDKWTKSKWAKDVKGKRASEIVFTSTFWNNVDFTLNAMGPLVRVLRLVDNEKKPAMGYIYEGMERAKTAIATSLGRGSHDYMTVSEIIDKRWNSQLHHPLHAAGYYLNPQFYCKNDGIENDTEVSTGLHDCINRLTPNKSKQDEIVKELVIWVNQEGFFSLDVAKRAQSNLAPAEWWKLYGKGTPNLQQLAVRVLSLTCSASGCERNWSTFEQIHSKKRNRLEHKKLQELAFVRYNNTLRYRRDSNVAYDPISLDHIDESNEWMTGRMEEDHVFEGEDLTYEAVGKAMGAGEVRPTRSSQPSSSRGLVDEESDDEDTEDDSEPEKPIEIEDNSDGFIDLDD